MSFFMSFKLKYEDYIQVKDSIKALEQKISFQTTMHNSLHTYYSLQKNNVLDVINQFENKYNTDKKDFLSVLEKLKKNDNSFSKSEILIYQKISLSKSYKLNPFFFLYKKQFLIKNLNRLLNDFESVSLKKLLELKIDVGQKLEILKKEENNKKKRSSEEHIYRKNILEKYYLELDRIHTYIYKFLDSVKIDKIIISEDLDFLKVIKTYFSDQINRDVLDKKNIEIAINKNKKKLIDKRIKELSML